jgi:hypothetical protein
MINIDAKKGEAAQNINPALSPSWFMSPIRGIDIKHTHVTWNKGDGCKCEDLPRFSE